MWSSCSLTYSTSNHQPPRRHDFHHSHNVGTYGAMTRFWDAVMVRAFFLSSFLSFFLSRVCVVWCTPIDGSAPRSVHP